MTVVLRVDPLSPEPTAIGIAAETIRSGGLVAFPTETVYGLGANAFDDQATLKIFKAKGRPADNPLIVHVSSLKQLEEVAEPPEWARTVLSKLWPGPLTVVLPRKRSVPDTVTAGLNTVAVRMPAHPVALRLIERSGVPIAAPSANTSTRPSPTRAEHVVEDMWGKVDVVLDGGETFFGVESTIIQAEDGRAHILRPGPYTPEELARFFQEVEVSPYAYGASADRPVAPGMKYKHYAPRKPLFMAASRQALVELSSQLCKKGYEHVVLCTQETSRLVVAPVIVLGGREDLYGVAKNLFHSFRVFDRRPEGFGLMEPFEESGIGLAIMNRAKKACGGLVVASVEDVLKNLRLQTR